MAESFVTFRLPCGYLLKLKKGFALLEFALKGGGKEEKKKKKEQVALGGLFAVCLMWHGWEGKVKLLFHAIGMLSLRIVIPYCCHQI